MSEQPFKLDLQVRDYECDMGGIVNNSVYLNYIEHTRHAFLKHKGSDYAELTNRGINLVVYRIEADYLYSLRSGDSFYVTAALERISKLRFGFLQEIYRSPDNTPIFKAKVFCTSLNLNGRPTYFKEIDEFFQQTN